MDSISSDSLARGRRGRCRLSAFSGLGGGPRRRKGDGGLWLGCGGCVGCCNFGVSTRVATTCCCCCCCNFLLIISRFLCCKACTACIINCSSSNSWFVSGVDNVDVVSDAA